MSFPNQDDQRLTFVSVSVLLKKPTKHLLVIYQPAHRSQSAYLFHPPTQETTPFNGCLLMGACRNAALRRPGTRGNEFLEDFQDYPSASEETKIPSPINRNPK